MVEEENQRGRQYVCVPHGVVPDGVVERAIISEAPSPAPAPSVIQAERVDNPFIVNCQFIKDLSDDKIRINIMKSDTKINYIREIIHNEFWQKISVHFQNDFEKFYNMLKTSLEGDNIHIQAEISYLPTDKIKINMKHEGLFSFDLFFLLDKEEDRIDKMEQQIQFLIQQNRGLTEKTEYLYEIIKEHSNWHKTVDKGDYLWLKFQGMDSYDGENYFEETHSCYATLVENSKKTLIKKGYESVGGFSISNLGSTAYFRNKNYNQLIKGLNWRKQGPAEPGKRKIHGCGEEIWGTDFYICIPKSGIGIGLGETHIRNPYQAIIGARERALCEARVTGPKKKYHGNPDGDGDALPPRGFFVCNKEKYEIKRPISETYLPPQVFCTNCSTKPYEKDPKFLVCQCLGH